MTARRTWILGMALGGTLLFGGGARADMISYLATGTFDSGGTPLTPTYTSITDPSTTVAYTSALSTATVPPENQVSLGTFTTASGAGSATPTAVSSGFILTITNTATSDSITFTGTMTGAISSSTSTAFVQFSSPLSETLDGFLFKIVSQDSGTPGRVNLAAPTTNLGVSTINATVNAVPEPASVALLGLGIPALAGLAYRRARRNTGASLRV